MTIDLEAASRLADRAEIQSGGNPAVYQLASTVRGLVERVRESPAWHVRPTEPGVWLWAHHEFVLTSATIICVGDPERYVTEGSPLWYGPLPDPPREESTNA